MAAIYEKYENGQQKAFENSFENYYSAAAFGYNKAEYLVARKFACGTGCEKNLKEAFKYYNRSVEHGGIGYTELGGCYREGSGVELDEYKAFAMFLKGVENGETVAYDNVGYAYEYGKGVEKNYILAIEYYKKGNDAYGNRKIGKMYLEGKGVEVNRDIAKSYLQVASNLGDKEAKEILKNQFGF